VILSYINLGKGDWWQRARLIDAARDTFFQWWLTGYGGVDPGWGSKEGGYFWGSFTDMNNQFLLYGVEGGILAIVGLCGVLAVSFHGLCRADKQTYDAGMKSIYWSMGCSLVGVIAGWMGVSYFGQSNALFYSLLGVIGSSVVFIKYAAPYKRVRRRIENRAYAGTQAFEGANRLYTKL
jgi:hypothetical protein